MGRLKLTDKLVKASRSDVDRGEDLRDATVRGLVLRVYASGRKTWSVRYRTEDGRRRVYRLGDVALVEPAPEGALTLKEARRRAAALLGDVAKGEDPQASREAIRAAGTAETVAELAEEYLTRYAERNKRPRSVREDRRQIDSYVVPAWGPRQARDISRRDVKRLLEDLADGTLSLRGQPTTTAPMNLRALLSKMFAWAVEEEIVPANPAAGVPLPVRPTSRDRVLSEEEVRVLWRELRRLEEDAPLSAAAFRLLLLTAQRPGEVLGIRWADVAGAWWTIPAERFKGRRSHRVPLSPQALAVLDAVRPLTGDREHVFDSPKVPGQPIGTLKTSAATIRRDAGMEHWTPHDLRRSAATHLTSGGTPRLVVERILGHAEHGVAAVYDRSSYDAEKRRALVWWGRKVEQIAAGKPKAAEVVEFPGGRS
jgi:integrase